MRGLTLIHRQLVVDVISAGARRRPGGVYFIPTGVKRQLLIKAIGEDELLEQLRQEYPALQDPAGSTPEAIVEGVAEMKRLLKYNDNTIADKLGLGRTTLWRMQKKSGAAKAKKEE